MSSSGIIICARMLMVQDDGGDSAMYKADWKPAKHITEDVICRRPPDC